MTPFAKTLRKASTPISSFELASLEPRRLFAVSAVANAIGPISVNPDAPTQTISLTGAFNRTGTVVSFPVSYGVGASRVNTNLNLTLFDETPITRTNFLAYISSGKYNGSIIHRNAKGFVLQGGGYKTNGSDVGDFGSILNEFEKSPRDLVGRVNTKGTLAMAKIANNPNSATSEFFINLNDNTGKDANGVQLPGDPGKNGLDFQNSGFTTFAKLFDSSIAVAEAIEALPTGNASSINGAWDNLPVADLDTTKGLVDDNFVVFGQASVDDTPDQTFTYTVTSGDTSIVNASIDANGNLVLDYGSGTSGTTTVTVTATDPSGAAASTTFSVNLAFINVKVDGITVNSGQAVPFVIANRPAGSAPTQSTISITNNDATALSLNPGFTAPDGFRFIDAPTSPITLAPGESRNFTLEFSATENGSYNGNVTIPSTVNSFTFPIIGSVGLPPGQLGVKVNNADVTSGQAAPVDVGVASSVRGATRSFVVTNTGGVAVSLTQASVGPGFTITQALPNVLAAGATATLIVAVDVASGPGAKTATLTIPNNGLIPSFSIPLTANVARTIKLDASVSSVTFVDDGGSTTKYTYKGAGSVTLAVTGAAADATTKGKSAVFDGSGILLADVLFDGSTNATTSLTASVKGGDGASALTNLTATAPIGNLKLSGVTLTNLTGTNLTSLTVAAINGTITAGVAGGSVSAGVISNATINLTNDIKAFTAQSISGSTVSLSGADTVVIKGEIANSTVSLTGAPKTFSAASVTNSTINSAAGVGNVSIKGAVASTTFNLVGPVNAVKTGALTSSTVNIGVSSTGFLGTSSVKSVSFASISKSTLAVSSAQTINLGSFTTDAGDLTTVRLKTAKSLSGTGTSKFSLKNIATGTDVTTAPAAAGLPASRLAITVVA